jgi:hypothetical protein
MPQILGFSFGREESSEQDFRPERMAGIFAPPPLFLAFHRNDAVLGDTWTSIGIGAKPGDYQFPAFEYTGSRYAGASFYVDYMGYRTIDGHFASPVLAIHFAYSPLDALRNYTAWLNQSGFATNMGADDVAWHHLPIFCGWAEQTVESVPQGTAPNKLSTQANYDGWLATSGTTAYRRSHRNRIRSPLSVHSLHSSPQVEARRHSGNANYECAVSRIFRRHPPE